MFAHATTENDASNIGRDGMRATSHMALWAADESAITCQQKGFVVLRLEDRDIGGRKSKFSRNENSEQSIMSDEATKHQPSRRQAQRIHSEEQRRFHASTPPMRAT